MSSCLSYLLSVWIIAAASSAKPDAIAKPQPDRPKGGHGSGKRNAGTVPADVRT